MTAFRAARVVEDLRRLDQLTGGPDGSRRLAWTADWLAARTMLRNELAELPVTVDVDPAGNLWAVLAGLSDDMLVVGSHLDSVPKGGWLDGALGVMAGLELLRALAADGTPPVTVALVDWADEEGARFGRSLFGSAACMRTLDLDRLRTLTDRDGAALPAVLAEHGVRLDRVHDAASRVASARAYVEVHIEQGPVLETMGMAIGAVTGTRGIEREQVTFVGQAAHSGTTPMQVRRDSFRAAARFALALAEIGERHGGVTTVGQAVCRPGVVTAVAGETRVAMDMRHIDAAALQAMFDDAVRAADVAADKEGCTVQWDHVFRIPPMPFDPRLLAIARAAVGEVAGQVIELESGALHDASEMARRIPTVMIFSSSTNGLSHTKEEDTPEAHLCMAADAFERTCRAAMAMIASGELAGSIPSSPPHS